MSVLHYDVFDQSRNHPEVVDSVNIRRTVTVVTVGAELMTLAEAKSELGVFDTGDAGLDADTDARLTAKLKLVRQWCEDITYKRYTSTATTETLEIDYWPAREIQLDNPPLISVASVEYYDDADAQQTLVSTMYNLLTPTKGRGRIVFGETFDRPQIKRRADAIKVTYDCGYAAAANIPGTVIEAAKLMLSFFWDNDREDVILRTYERSAVALLRGEDWGGYV